MLEGLLGFLRRGEKWKGWCFSDEKSLYLWDPKKTYDYCFCEMAWFWIRVGRWGIRFKFSAREDLVDKTLGEFEFKGFSPSYSRVQQEVFYEVARMAILKSLES